MAISLDRIKSRIIVKMPGVPIPIIEEGIVDAIRHFCGYDEWPFFDVLKQVHTIEEEDAGTVALTQGNANIVGTTTAFDNLGTDPALGCVISIEDRGSHLCSITNATTLVMDNKWTAASASGLSYTLNRIAYNLPATITIGSIETVYDMSLRQYIFPHALSEIVADVMMGNSSFSKYYVDYTEGSEQAVLWFNASSADRRDFLVQAKYTDAAVSLTNVNAFLGVIPIAFETIFIILAQAFILEGNKGYLEKLAFATLLIKKQQPKYVNLRGGRFYPDDMKGVQVNEEDPIFLGEIVP